jgi:hypothetical protein
MPIPPGFKPSGENSSELGNASSIMIAIEARLAAINQAH